MKNTGFTMVIVGRENVGKSSLFNKLINQQKAIVDDWPGVTRDKLYGECDWEGHTMNVVDTGGILFEESDVIKSLIVKQIKPVLKAADLVLFVTDVQAGIIPDDSRILDFIKKCTDKYVLVVNKVDNDKLQQDAYEFYNMGVDKIFPVSVTHSIGLDDILDYAVTLIPEETEDVSKADETTKIALIGKENVGKSSLFNALVEEERSIVTDIPGTTRDTVDTKIEINGQSFLLLDTAGIKKRNRIKAKVEQFSIGRAFMNIQKANIVIHIVDAIEGIQEIDKKILGYAFENFKGMIIAVNKWDLVSPEKREALRKEYDDYLKQNINFINFVPIVFISALKEMGIEKLIDTIFLVQNQYNFRVKTSVLNKVFREAIYDRNPSSKSGQLKAYYMTQVRTAPPTFVVFVNKKERLHFSYLRYLENRLRSSFGFEGAPIKLKIKQRENEQNT